MESIEIEGTSIEEAVERACNALNTTTENLEYDIVGPKEESSSKARKKVKIIARKREESEDRAPLSEFASLAKEILANIIVHIDSSYSVSAFEFPDKVILNVKGDGSGLLIGRRGQTLDSLQHVLIKILQRKGKFPDKKILVDTEKYREKRADYLGDLARKLAEKVKRSRKALSVNPMSAFERRIVHLALEKVDGVYTESVGEGLERKVVIFPKDERRKNGR